MTAAWHTPVDNPRQPVIGRWFGVGLALALVVAACSAAAPPAPAASSGTTAPSAGIVSPEPSIDLRAAAGKAYLAATTAYNKALHPIVKTCGTSTVTAQVKCWKATYPALEKFEAAVRAITFPADTAADAKAVLRADASYDAELREASRVKTVADVNYWIDKLDKTGQATANASNLVRGDLGLPPVPTNP